MVVSHVLYYLGLLRLWQRVILRRRAVVLMYHRVLTAEERRVSGSHPALVVERDTFAMQMTVLKRWFTVLSLEEFADRVEEKREFPDSACVITFDDGWRDNFTNALPILSRLQLPAVVFLPMNYIGRRRLFWQETLAHLLVKAAATVRREPSREARLRSLLQPVSLEQVLDQAEGDPYPLAIETVAALKGRDHSDLEDLIGHLADALDVRRDDLAGIDAFMNWEEVDTMSRQGVAFGGHGMEHWLLTHVSGEEADAEIQGAKRVLDERFVGSVPVFSYPNGYLTSELVDKVRGAGYRLAFTTRRGFVRSGDDPYTIRRLNVHEAMTDTAPMFLARVLGLF